MPETKYLDLIFNLGFSSFVKKQRMNNSQIEIYQLKDEILKLEKTTVQLEKKVLD